MEFKQGVAEYKSWAVYGIWIEKGFWDLAKRKRLETYLRAALVKRRG